MKSSKFIIAVITVIFARNVLAVDFIVTESTSPLYKVEQPLSGDTKINLSAQQIIKVKIKNSKEAPARIAGPYNDIKPGKTLLEILAGLFGPQNERSVQHKLPDNLWYLDIDRKEDVNFCYRVENPPVFWRAKTGKGLDLNLSLQEKQAVPVMPGSKITLEWPQDEIPLKDGEVYKLAIDDAHPREITLYQFPPDGEFPSDTYKVIWMDEHGCVEQARLISQSEGIAQ